MRQPIDADAWRPVASVTTSRNRARMARRARDFLDTRGVLEVDTPLLGATTVTDPNTGSLGAADGSWHLQTSPEYFMKRLLAAGYPDIYQICKVFRDGESGRHHRAEFTMVEWYRLNFSLQDMLHETAQFISHVLQRSPVDSVATCLSYSEAFGAACGADPLTCDIKTLADCASADADLRASLGDDRDAWLDLLMSERVARTFDPQDLTVIYHYPASQAALARLCPANSAAADRFEVYCGTLELANGYVELLDADAQRARFESDLEKCRQLKKTRHRIDSRLIAALRHGLPPCAGVAVGFDRLLMLSEKHDDISNVNTFPNEFAG